MLYVNHISSKLEEEKSHGFPIGKKSVSAVSDFIKSWGMHLTSGAVSLWFFFFKFYFIFKLYNIVLVLPNIEMNPPQVYLCSPSWTLLPPPSSLPIPSLWVVPVHQPQASSIVHRTWTGDSFHTWYYTCFLIQSDLHPQIATPQLSLYSSPSSLPQSITQRFIYYMWLNKCLMD